MKSSILGVIRHVLTTAGGYLAPTGLIAGSDIEAGVGAIMVLIGLGWSIWDKKSA